MSRFMVFTKDYKCSCGHNHKSAKTLVDCLDKLEKAEPDKWANAHFAVSYIISGRYGLGARVRSYFSRK